MRSPEVRCGLRLASSVAEVAKVSRVRIVFSFRNAESNFAIAANSSDVHPTRLLFVYGRYVTVGNGM